MSSQNDAKIKDSSFVLSALRMESRCCSKSSFNAWEIDLGGAFCLDGDGDRWSLFRLEGCFGANCAKLEVIFDGPCVHLLSSSCRCDICCGCFRCVAPEDALS